MNIARASVRRPVFTCMVTLMVVVLGLVALTRLQIDFCPASSCPPSPYAPNTKARTPL